MLLIVEELLLLEPLLQEVNLTVKIIKFTMKTMIMKIAKIILIQIVNMSLIMLMIKMNVKGFPPPLGCLSRNICRFSLGQTFLGSSYT